MKPNNSFKQTSLCGRELDQALNIRFWPLAAIRQGGADPNTSDREELALKHSPSGA